MTPSRVVSSRGRATRERAVAPPGAFWRVWPIPPAYAGGYVLSPLRGWLPRGWRFQPQFFNRQGTIDVMLVLSSVALWFSVVLLIALAAGSLLNLSRHPHWFVRGWDFPRVQIITLGIICLSIYFAVRLLSEANLFGSPWRWPDTAIVLLGSALVIWHLVPMLSYTPLGRRQVLATTSPDDKQTLRLVISNVEMENEAYDLWLQVIAEAEPDIIIAVEVNERWLQKIESLRAEFPVEVAQPQDNWYGMLILSKLPLSDVETRFLVEKDVPSIHATAELRSGKKVRISAIHPRPPEPVRGNDSDHRDAELVVLAQELEDESLPVIVGGDLNDVAWSSTTRLFLRLSQLLDPRRGRGFFNTFHAQHFWLRFPLDHIFHSRDFTLRKLARLGNVGSDHFPMLIELQYEPSEKAEQPPLELDEEHEEFAEEVVEREEERGQKSLSRDQRPPIRGIVVDRSAISRGLRRRRFVGRTDVVIALRRPT